MTVWVETDLCDGCRRCLKACPYGAIDMKAKKAVVLDHCTSCGACIQVCKNEAMLTDVVPREIPDFTDRQGVWVFAEQRKGQLTRVSLELLGKARSLGEELGQQTAALLVGNGVSGLGETLISHGADKVFLMEHALLDVYRSEPYTIAMETVIRDHRPNILLVGATHIGRDLAPRLAHRLGVGLTADCTELTIDPGEKILLQTRPAFGGNVMATIANRYSRPQMATVRPGVMKAEEFPGHKGELVNIEISLTSEMVRTEVLDSIKEEKRAVELSSAKVIIAGGRGVGNAQGFEVLRELAAVMDGEVAGTRVAVEEGWISSDHQVGQTGVTVRPEIYIACGISGAIQHRAGMMNSRYVVAINNDPRAPIFQVADWGIVGDVTEIVPELIEQLKQGRENVIGL
ncbi:MAG: electron transfer flavoprotein subunit alpha [Desulfobacteraceae bacterium]|nr:electron transfer flavoprotein subunit alpha [Desulfobacteraceae bacterium]